MGRSEIRIDERLFRTVDQSSALRVIGATREWFYSVFAPGRFGDEDGAKVIRTSYQNDDGSRLTLENCLELMFLFVLTSSGISAIAARDRVKHMLMRARTGRLPSFWVRNWLTADYLDGRGMQFTEGARSLFEVAWAQLAPISARGNDDGMVSSPDSLAAETLVAVNLDEKVRRIHALFDEEVK